MAPPVALHLRDSSTSLPNSLCVSVLHSQKLCHSRDAELVLLLLACELTETPLYAAITIPNVWQFMGMQWLRLAATLQRR